jgi:hypothetical protein
MTPRRVFREVFRLTKHVFLTFSSDLHGRKSLSRVCSAPFHQAARTGTHCVGTTAVRICPGARAGTFVATGPPPGHPPARVVARRRSRIPETHRTSRATCDWRGWRAWEHWWGGGAGGLRRWWGGGAGGAPEPLGHRSRRGLGVGGGEHLGGQVGQVDRVALDALADLGAAAVAVGDH